MRVLFVEDEPDLGAAIKSTLKHERYVVDWVMDGTEAWAYLENQWTQYTLAILDWLLPGMSGLELCKRLRDQNNPLPVLMLTALDHSSKKDLSYVLLCSDSFSSGTGFIRHPEL